MRWFGFVFTLVAVLGLTVAAQTAGPTDIESDEFLIEARRAAKFDPGVLNSIILDSTVEFRCDRSVWTGVVLFRAVKPKPAKASQSTVLTAAHGLSQCMASGAVAVGVRFRIQNPSYSPQWDVVERKLEIVREGRAIWVQHATADVAAIDLEIPPGAIQHRLPASVLADEETFKRSAYFGNTAYILGFPFGESISGFPILRIAQITSRTAESKAIFALSSQIFPGDSGGPVYTVDRGVDGVRFAILGLMIKTMIMKSNAVQTNGGLNERLNFVSVGYVARSADLRETLELLANNTRKTARN